MSELEQAAETSVATEERLYTVEEMADFLQVKVGALKDWTKLEENPCPCLRYESRILRFEKPKVLEWLRSQTDAWWKKRKPDLKLERKGD